MTSELDIEKNIPIPLRLRDIVAKMEIGDSFLISSTKIRSLHQRCGRGSVKITTRKVDEKTHRVWRVG